MPRILSLVRLKPTESSAIRDLDSSIELVEAGGVFEAEYAATWPAISVARYVRASGRGTRSERDAMLENADVAIIGFPFPLDLKARSPRLRWVHQTPAGASNLKRGDLWNSDIAVTTSRGLGESTAIAEYAIAAILHFAKDFDRAAQDRNQSSFHYGNYRPLGIRDKTLCVIGAGGIGREIARLGKALGLRVVGTRASLKARCTDDDFDILDGPGSLHELLGMSDFVAVSCQWTDTTTNLLDEAAFKSMRANTVLVNVARGEIIDETAMLAALDGEQLRGAVLDVFVGEFEHEPPARLWQHPKVLVTPHTSALTDVSTRRALDLFVSNLRAFLNDEPLENRIDWRRGY